MNFHGRRPLFNVAVGLEREREREREREKKKGNRECSRVILERGLTAFQLVERKRDSIDLFLQGFVNLDNYLDN